MDVSLNTSAVNLPGVVVDPVYKKTLPTVSDTLEQTTLKNSSFKVNELCLRCQEFPNKSSILQMLSLDKEMQQENLPETLEFGTLGELLSSSLSGCHFCTLLCNLLWNSLPNATSRERLRNNLGSRLQVRIELIVDITQNEKTKSIFKDFMEGMVSHPNRAYLQLVVDKVEENFNSEFLKFSIEKSIGPYTLATCQC